MSPDEAEVLLWIIQTVAEIKGREAARRLVDTLQQRFIIAEDRRDAVQQGLYRYIDIHTGAEAAAAAAAANNGEQHMESGA